MRAGARVAALVVPALLCAAAWLPRGGGDATDLLAGAVVEPNAAPDLLTRALDAVAPGSWTAAETGGNRPGARRYRVDRGAKSGTTPVGGYVTNAVSAGRVLGWVTLGPVGDAGADLDRHERAGAFAAALFDVEEVPGRPPLYPSVPEFLRRLGGPPRVAPLAGRWQVPAAFGERQPIVVASGSSPESREGFVLVALQATVEAHRVAADDFARQLAAAAAGGARIPTPRPLAGRSTWSAPFRSERDLKTGELLLTEAVELLSKGQRGDGVAVSGLDAHLRLLLDGPGDGQVSAILETVPEGVALRILLPATSRDAEMLARLPQGLDAAADVPRGQLVWSGRIRSRARAAYAGEVWELSESAFEWRPSTP